MGRTWGHGEKGEVGPRGISPWLARRGAGRTCRHGDGRDLAAESAPTLLQSMSCTNDKGSIGLAAPVSRTVGWLPWEITTTLPWLVNLDPHKCDKTDCVVLGDL